MSFSAIWTQFNNFKNSYVLESLEKHVKKNLFWNAILLFIQWRIVDLDNVSNNACAGTLLTQPVLWSKLADFVNLIDSEVILNRSSIPECNDKSMWNDIFVCDWQIR